MFQEGIAIQAGSGSWRCCKGWIRSWLQEVIISRLPVQILLLEQYLDSLEEAGVKLAQCPGYHEKDYSGSSLASHIESAGRRTTDTLASLQQRFRNIHLYYYDKAIELYTSGNLAEARLTAERAFRLRSSYQPAAILLAEYLLDEGDVVSADSIITLFVSENNIQQPLNDDLQQICIKIILDYKRHIDALIREEAYPDAILSINLALDYTLRFRIEGEQNNLLLLLSRARNGLTGSYCQVAGKALRSGNPRLARNYLNKARETLFSDADHDHLPVASAAEADLLIECLRETATGMYKRGYSGYGAELQKNAGDLCASFPDCPSCLKKVITSYAQPPEEIIKETTAAGETEIPVQFSVPAGVSREGLLDSLNKAAFLAWQNELAAALLLQKTTDSLAALLIPGGGH